MTATASRPTAPAPAPKPRRRRQRGGIHPLAVAIIAIVVTVAITYYAFTHTVPFQSHFTMSALVSNSVNVRSGSPVRIAGIDVGAVTGVDPGPGQTSKVTFTLNDNGLPIHRDATLRIRDRLFLEGGYYLELSPGTPSSPIAKSGYEIPESQTSSPVQFYKVLSTFDLPTRRSLQNLLNTMNQAFSAQPGQSLAQSGAGGFKRTVPQLTPTLKDVAWVSRALRGTQPGDIHTLLTSAASVTGTLAGVSPQLVDLVHSLNVTSTALAATDGALAQTIVGLDRTLQVAPATLAAIDRALPAVVNLSRALTPVLKVSPPLIREVTRSVEQLGTVVSEPERTRLLAALKATFVEFPTIQRQLASVFPTTKPVSDCLHSHVVPIFKAQIPDGENSTGRPVWQDFAHFLPGVAGASGNFDGNGPYTRVLAGAGTNTVTGGILGSIPILGQLVGASTPGGDSILGARPSWVGDLSSSAFHPEVPCTSQPVPSLAAPAAASDLRSTHTPPAKPLTRGEAMRLASASGSGR
jgi:phospholipid/cholesterol/gamma-HCH transport system substrate-binding protein